MNVVQLVYQKWSVVSLWCHYIYVVNISASILDNWLYSAAPLSFWFICLLDCRISMIFYVDPFLFQVQYYDQGIISIILVCKYPSGQSARPVSAYFFDDKLKLKWWWSCLLFFYFVYKYIYDYEKKKKNGATYPWEHLNMPGYTFSMHYSQITQLLKFYIFIYFQIHLCIWIL